MKKGLTLEQLEDCLQKEESFKLEVCYDMDELQEAMRSLGYEDLDDYDTNGFQVDWWQSWKKGDITWEFSGSFWYSSLEGICVK